MEEAKGFHEDGFFKKFRAEALVSASRKPSSGANSLPPGVRLRRLVSRSARSSRAIRVFPTRIGDQTFPHRADGKDGGKEKTRFRPHGIKHCHMANELRTRHDGTGLGPAFKRVLPTRFDRVTVWVASVAYLHPLHSPVLYPSRQSLPNRCDTLP